MLSNVARKRNFNIETESFWGKEWKWKKGEKETWVREIQEISTGKANKTEEKVQKDEEKARKDEEKARRVAESRGAGRRKQKALIRDDAETTSRTCNERNI